VETPRSSETSWTVSHFFRDGRVPSLIFLPHSLFEAVGSDALLVLQPPGSAFRMNLIVRTVAFPFSPSSTPYLNTLSFFPLISKIFQPSPLSTSRFSGHLMPFFLSAALPAPSWNTIIGALPYSILLLQDSPFLIKLFFSVLFSLPSLSTSHCPFSMDG